jgi:hypothetical protein
VSVLLQPASHREGLGLGRKASPPDALIVAPPRDIPVPLLHLDPALNAMAAKALARNSHVSKIAYLLDLSGAVGVDAEQGFPPAPDSGVAAEVTAAIHLQVARDHLDVGVADREQGIEVVAAEGVSSSVLLFHVLLRHRPLSIVLVGGPIKKKGRVAGRASRAVGRVGRDSRRTLLGRP